MDEEGKYYCKFKFYYVQDSKFLAKNSLTYDLMFWLNLM